MRQLPAHTLISNKLAVWINSLLLNLPTSGPHANTVSKLFFSERLKYYPESESDDRFCRKNRETPVKSDNMFCLYYDFVGRAYLLKLCRI